MALYFRDTDPYHGHAQIAELEIVYDEHGKFFHTSHAGSILETQILLIQTTYFYFKTIAQKMNIGQTASIVLRRLVANIKVVHLAIPELTVVWSRNDAFVTMVTHVTKVSTIISFLVKH